MSASNPSLDPEFIERQRRRLEALRDQLLGVERTMIAEERSFQEKHGSEVEDEADAGDYDAQEDVYQSLRNVDETRLRRIERALQKVAEGSYGYSDRSGDPIPRSRLQAVPEATLTIDEEQQAEKEK